MGSPGGLRSQKPASLLVRSHREEQREAREFFPLPHFVQKCGKYFPPEVRKSSTGLRAEGQDKDERLQRMEAGRPHQRRLEAGPRTGDRHRNGPNWERCCCCCNGAEEASRIQDFSHRRRRERKKRGGMRKGRRSPRDECERERRCSAWPGRRQQPAQTCCLSPSADRYIHPSLRSFVVILPHHEGKRRHVRAPRGGWIFEKRRGNRFSCSWFQPFCFWK